MKFIKLFAIAILILAVIFGIGFALILFAPYNTYEYVRSSDLPTSIKAQYVDIQGDPLCTKFYLVNPNGETGPGVFIRVAGDIPNPNRATHFKDGDPLTLEGFTYLWKKTNRITGKVITKPIYQIDLIAWQDNHNNYYKSKAREASEFKGENHTDCRP